MWNINMTHANSLMKRLFVVWLLVANLAYAQENSSPSIEDINQPNATPRQTVKMILSSVAEQSEEGLASNFDVRPSKLVKDAERQKVIKNFPSMLNKYGSLLPVGIISNKAEGTHESELGIHLERVGQIKVENYSISIVLERVEDKGGEMRWLVSQETIQALSKVSNRVFTSKINTVLPVSLLDSQWRGAPVGHWFSMPILLLLSAVCGWIAIVTLRRASKSLTSSKRGAAFSALRVPAGIVVAVTVFVSLERYLGISILIRQDFSTLTVSLLWIALFIFIWSFVDKLSAQGEQVLREKNKVTSLSLLVFLRASGKTVLLVIAVILVLDSNGVDVTTGLAALGIGSIALALGAQKTIENIVGSIVVIVDQPFRVGDFCKVGETLGTIEKIGLRSTRIRTLEDTLVTYPNGDLSTERVENYTMRRKFLLRTTLNLRYETKMDDLEKLLAVLRDALSSNANLAPEGQRVRFIGYGAASLDVEIFVYVRAATYDEFLSRQESILLNINHVIMSNGSGFAYPSQTLYMAKDKPPE